jgi:hypothetical protein
MSDEIERIHKEVLEFERIEAVSDSKSQALRLKPIPALGWQHFECSVFCFITFALVDCAAEAVGLLLMAPVLVGEPFESDVMRSVRKVQNQ